MKLNCKNCDRFLGEVEMLVGEILCGNSACKAGNQYKIITSDTDKMLRFKFTNDPKPAKSIQKEIKDE